MKNKKLLTRLSVAGVTVLVISLLGGIFFLHTQVQKSKAREQDVQSTLAKIKGDLEATSQQYVALKNTDQVAKNKALEEENKNIHDTYIQSVMTYENLLKLKESTNKTTTYDEEYAKSLKYLSERKYASASATLVSLDKAIAAKQAELATAFKVPQNVPQDNTAPGNGYKRQLVHTDRGDYMVDVIAADLNSTKVIVDTASDGDCANDCPTMSLGDFASRSGAFAAVNGQYFCPSTYPSCADKKNAFDTLLMNKNKVYFNSSNNVYSTNPAAIFGAGYSRFVGHASEWGRDTGIDAVISNWPLLVAGGNIAVSDAGDAKQSGKGSRAFIGGSNNMVYIGIIYNASVTDMASVLHTMGIQNALNLDSGGSLALWNNGRYLAGPGRGLPFGILLVRR